MGAGRRPTTTRSRQKRWAGAWPGRALCCSAGGELVAALTRANLVDVFVLLIHPLLLGTGRHLFPDGTRPAHLKLATAVTTNAGVVIATYDAQFAG